MGTFYRPQYAEDWGFLDHHCLPTNMDGLVERHGHFLLLEVKRGDMQSEGQRIMLEALARLPNWTVIVVHSRSTAEDDMHSRPVEPWAYEVVGEGHGGSCDPEEFKLRYRRWFLTKEKSAWL